MNKLQYVGNQHFTPPNHHIISVIVPVYNAESFLDETLQSVLSQTYENWECIIVNDGSTDNTESIAKRWCKRDARFRYFYKENGGLSSARNLGIKYSNADYIAFLDSDDVLTKNSLEIRINTILKENVDLVYSNAYRINYREYTKQLLRCVHTGKVEDISIFLEINQATPSTVLCRKKIIEDIGGFTWDKKAEDLYCWLNLLLNNNSFYGIESPLVYYRILDHSMSASDRNCTKEIIAIIEDLKLMLINSKVNYSKYLKLWVRRYILLKNEQGKIEKNIKERIKYVNNIIPNYFPRYLIYLPIGETARKLIAIQIMNHKIKEI